MKKLFVVEPQEWYKEGFEKMVHGMNWANRSTSVGYWIGEKYQGKGIITKSCNFNHELNLQEYQILSY